MNAMIPNRRLSIFGMFLLQMLSVACSKGEIRGIDGYRLVHRHLPHLAMADPLSPFTVGNGGFAYTVDFTGLQTFPDFYEQGIPLATQSNWGWHTIPNSHHYVLEDATENWQVEGRPVPYASLQQTQAGQWLRANPHRLHLGRIGFQLLDSTGKGISIGDIADIDQTVDLWQRIIKSSFQIERTGVEVETACHPYRDQIGARIRSSLLQSGQIRILFEFPNCNPAWGKDPADWNHPDRHGSEIIDQDNQSVAIKRTLDADGYFVFIRWSGAAKFTQSLKPFFLLTITEANQFEFSAMFSLRL